jgi:hypothetical protein
MEPSLSTQLAIRTFDADAEFCAALAEFQKAPREALIVAEARRASEYGLSWYARPSEVAAFQVVLCHKGGAEREADGESISALLAGLLGHPLAHDVAVVAAQASEPESRDLAVEAFNADPAFASFNCIPETPAQVAAESLAAATGGAVVLGPSEYVPDPEVVDPGFDPSQPLTDGEIAEAVAMLKGFNPEERKSFTISFRSAFRVPREEKGISPLIKQARHLKFFYDWKAEANGKVAP